MRPELLAITGIFLVFGLLEFFRTRLFSKPEQTRDDAFVEIIGSFVLLTLTQPGIFLATQFILGSVAPQWQDALAGSDCRLLRLGDQELQSLMASDPAVTRLLLKTMALTVQLAFNLIESSRNLSVPQRLAQALLQLCGDQGYGTEIMATQQDLADLVGVSRVSLGKALAGLQAAGIIEPGYGFVTIRDGAALQAVVAG